MLYINFKISADAAHDENNEISNDDFNTMMDKKLSEVQSSTISGLTKNWKLLTQSEFQNIIKEYKNQLEEVSSTVAMLQQCVTNLKQENLNLQKKTKKDRQDIEKYCEENEEYGLRICLRIKNMKKQENESSDKVLEAVKCLFSDASINIPDACIDRAHRISRIDDTVIVHFTIFRHRTMFCRNRKIE